MKICRRWEKKDLGLVKIHAAFATPTRAAKALSSLSRHHQIILYRKNSKHAVGSDAGQVLVGLAVHHAFQRHMSAVHDDANGAVGADAIVLQRAVAVDGVEYVAAQAIVVERSRQDFNAIIDSLHALNLFHHALGLALEQRLCDLAKQDHVIAVQLECDVVESAEIGKHQDLVADFFGDARLGFGGKSLIGLRDGRRE